jgi:hypothetical protein
MHEGERSRSRSRDRSYARTGLVAGLVLLLVGVCLTLTRHPVSVAASNGVRHIGELATLSSGATICQGGESLPAGTTAIRIALFALVGPRVDLRVSSGTSTLTRGELGSGWTAGTATIPVARLPRSHSRVSVCATLGQSFRSVSAIGQESAPDRRASMAGRRLPGQLGIEYLRSSASSWWSSILAVARRMGLGHSPAGTWVVLLLAALMLAAIVVACRAVLAGPFDGRPPRALLGIPSVAWACAAVACLNAVCWSLITPPFQAPDEPDHYAYVERLAETGQLPTIGTEDSHSSQESFVLTDLHFSAVAQNPAVPTIATIAEQRQLEHDLALPLSQLNRTAGVASSEPPLYYALQTIPYRLSANVLTRLELMRLLSALFAAVTALFAVLFLREALPGVPWAWTVGGLGVALAPLLGFISGAVNPDAMLTAVSTALFYCIARGLRRGLSTRLAIATGVVMAVGLLTKLNFIGLMPGAVLGLVVLTLREARASRARSTRASRARAAYVSRVREAHPPTTHPIRLLALALAIGGAPALVYGVLNALSGNPVLGKVSRVAPLLRGSVFHEVSYIWQLFLPRLPGMTSYFPGILTTRVLWFDRLIGFYGWLDTTFPGWVYELALVPTAIILALAARALVASRASLRARALELAVYGAMAVGPLVLVGADSYMQSSESQGELYAEPRYLLPMIVLMGALLALAARGAGRRWLPVAGALIVTAVLAHDLFSQLQVIARYHG